MKHSPTHQHQRLNSLYRKTEGHHFAGYEFFDKVVYLFPMVIVAEVLAELGTFFQKDGQLVPITT